MLMEKQWGERQRRLRFRVRGAGSVAPGAFFVAAARVAVPGAPRLETPAFPSLCAATEGPRR